MKVFISWSGRRSHEVAEALGPWLQKVVQGVEFFLSSEMERGIKWLAVIGEKLESHSIGIICVTPGNVNKPWVNFEAGALSRHLDVDGRVIPYLLDFHSPSDLKDPLGQFNASLADEDGTWQLVKTLNAQADYHHDDQALREIFDMWWPGLATRIEEIRGSVTSQPPERRSVEDKVDELLDLTRQLLRRSDPPSNSDLEEALGMRNAAAHGRVVLNDLDKPSLESLVRAFRGEGTLSVGPSTHPTKGEIANDVVGMMLRQAGLDLSTMKVVNVDADVIEIFVPISIHVSVLQKVRDALRTTTGVQEIHFFTRGDDMEMETIDPDNPGLP